MHRDQAISVDSSSAGTPSLGIRSATNVPNANDPAACPLGNECPPGDETASAEHHPSASQGRSRPTIGLMIDTKILAEITHPPSHSAPARLVRRRMNVKSTKSPHPPPIIVST